MNQPPGGNGYPPGYPYPGQQPPGGYPPPQQQGYGQPGPQGPQGPAGGMDRTIAMPNAPGFSPQGPPSPYGQPPPPAYGQPPQQGQQGAPPGYGQPQGAPPGYGQPQQGAPPGYGQPQGAPPAYGQPQGAPPGYGQPQGAPPGYGQAPNPAQYNPQMQQFNQQMNQGMNQAFGQVGNAMAGMPGVGGAMGAMGLSGAAGGRPTRRNAIMTMVIPLGVYMGGFILSSILAAVITPELGMLAMVTSLVAAVLGILSYKKMTEELKSVTQNAAFAWWPIFIPLYNLYWMLILLPQEVAKAKQMLGVQQPARSIVVYFFFNLYAFAADLNDMAG